MNRTERIVRLFLCPIAVALSLVGCGNEDSTSPDGVPPGRITDLRAASSTATTVTLEWTAVGDDGAAGRAESYDLRYSSSPIDSTSWGSALKASGEPTPREPGGTERYTVLGLEPNRDWYFCLEVVDDASNRSGLSNCASRATLPLIITIEAESFARSHDGGGAQVTIESCSGASAQHATEGVDFDGDWIEVDLTLSEGVCFSDSLRGEGILNDVRRFAIVFYQNGAVVESDTLETPPGKGFG